MRFRMKVDLRKQKQNERKCFKPLEVETAWGFHRHKLRPPLEQAFKGQPHAIVTHNRAGHCYFLF